MGITKAWGRPVLHCPFRIGGRGQEEGQTASKMFRASAKPRPSAIDSVTEHSDGVSLENVPWVGLMVFVAMNPTNSIPPCHHHLAWKTEEVGY